MPVFSFSSRPEQDPGQAPGDKENASYQKGGQRHSKSAVVASAEGPPRRRSFLTTAVTGAGRPLPPLDNTSPDESSAPALEVTSAAGGIGAGAVLCSSDSSCKGPDCASASSAFGIAQLRQLRGGGSDLGGDGFGRVAASPSSDAGAGTHEESNPAKAIIPVTPAEASSVAAAAKVAYTPKAPSSALEVNSASTERDDSSSGGSKKKPRWGFRMARAVFSPGTVLTPKREDSHVQPASHRAVEVNARIPGELKPASLADSMAKTSVVPAQTTVMAAVAVEVVATSLADTDPVSPSPASPSLGGDNNSANSSNDDLLSEDGLASSDEERGVGFIGDRSAALLTPMPAMTVSTATVDGSCEPSCVAGSGSEESAPANGMVSRVSDAERGKEKGDTSRRSPIEQEIPKDEFFECSSQVGDNAEAPSDSEGSDKQVDNEVVQQMGDAPRQKRQFSVASEDDGENGSPTLALQGKEEHHVSSTSPAASGAAATSPPVSGWRGADRSPMQGLPPWQSPGAQVPDPTAAAAIEAAVAATVAGDADAAAAIEAAVAASIAGDANVDAEAAAAATSTAVRVCFPSSVCKSVVLLPELEGVVEQEAAAAETEAAETESAADGSPTETAATLPGSKRHDQNSSQPTVKGLTNLGRRRNRRQAAQPELGLAYGHADDQAKFSQAEVNAKIRERVTEEQAALEKTMSSMKAAHEAELQAVVKKLQQSCSDGDRAKMAARDTEALEGEIAMLSERFGEAAAEAKANRKALLEKEALLDAVTAQLMGLKTELAAERESNTAEKQALREEADHERRIRSAAEGSLAQLEAAYNRLEDTEREKRAAGILKMKKDMQALAQAQFSVANKQYNVLKNRLEAAEAETRQLQEAAKTQANRLEAAGGEADELRLEMESLQRELVTSVSEATLRDNALREEVAALRHEAESRLMEAEAMAYQRDSANKSRSVSQDALARMAIRNAELKDLTTDLESKVKELEDLCTEALDELDREKAKNSSHESVEDQLPP